MLWQTMSPFWNSRLSVKGNASGVDVVTEFPSSVHVALTPGGVPSQSVVVTVKSLRTSASGSPSQKGSRERLKFGVANTSISRATAVTPHRLLASNSRR